QQVYQRDLGASFPNGITTDGEFLYVTDFSSNPRRVLKVDPIGNTHSTLVPNAGGQPNGIVWDPAGERLVVVFWGSNAPIKAYDRNTGSETVLLANSGVGNIDGVTIDCDGNFLIASWSPARISKFPPSFDQAGVNINVPGLSNPADIDFDPTNLRVCIPNSGNNTVTLFDYTCITSGILEGPTTIPLRAVPNPTGDRLRLDPPLEDDQPYVLLDARGLLVGGGTLRASAELDLSMLPTGVYLIHLTGSGRRLRIVKE
ncbi:MAG: SMP-30/gluconolactonase/LRE family protein, partial [Flavobacteriales bacterium]